MIHVLAYFNAKPGRRDALLAEFRKVMPIVKAEKGCLYYVPAIDTPGLGNDPTKLGQDGFVVVEHWNSLADLEAHAAAPHMATFFAAIKDLMADFTVHLVAPV
jgi:quinol monooxygenase YgiN